ncbi:MFS transporter [Mesorhizobium sp. BR1-1-16]|uniref:MFS transporter n=1 Tax=Mesorhizobium sp. BR1-1-16 TaxID=2876653 RepID=UPI001CCD09F7|nr:MFS transporter [Mesorhizobium sp. BR1-1-16]MBZ9935214.1 MFS transporter [Mesorhizobium sp. BR1-1-16]
MDQLAKAVSDKANRGVQATLALSMLLASLGTSIANIALPALTDAFAAPFSAVQWVVVAYLAGLTVSVVVVGRLGDRYGLRRMHLAGLALFAAASLLCGLAPSLPFLIGARALQGIGAAFLMTLSMALMRENADEAQIGRAMGLLGTVSALGTALGPSLGSVLIALAGWRGIFLVQVPLVALALALALATLPRGATARKAAPQSLWTALDRSIVPSLVVNLLVASVMMTTLVVGPFYLRLGLGLNSALVGLVMSVGPTISIATGVPSGWLVDALGPRRVLTIGLALLGAGSFLLAILPGMIGVFGYVLAIMVLTPGYQLFQAANNTAVLADIPRERRGTVSGLLNLSRNIGLITGASAMGAVFAYGVGTSDFAHADAAAIAAGMRVTFLLAGGLVLAAIVIALLPTEAILRGKVARPPA